MVKSRYMVYIAGPITPTGEGNHAIEYLKNVRAGIRVAIKLIKMGLTPVCPMIDFQYFLCCDEGCEITEDEIYDTSIALMLGCDVIFLLPGAAKSRGWKREKNIADENNIHIYTDLEELPLAIKAGVREIGVF